MWDRLKKSLAKTRDHITHSLKSIVSGKSFDVHDVEDILVSSDITLHTAKFLIQHIEKGADLTQELARITSNILKPCEKPLELPLDRLNIVLVAGVNGSGKTTTIAKLGHLFKRSAFVAADTFRAAAVEQLEFWGKKLEVPVYKGAPNQDPASVVFQAITKAQQDGVNTLFIDTAGRLHNKQHLMDEISKIVRVIKKIDPTAPHETLLVVDATIGTNVLKQIEAFKQAVPLTGIIMTKLDGTAKGGMLVSMAHEMNAPIYFVGTGETIDDLEAFDAEHFAKGLFEHEPIES